jgi:hypothetical protein
MFCAQTLIKLLENKRYLNTEAGIATLNLPINTTLFTAGVLASNAAFDS